ncbi:hypothetical protein BBP40_008708 [Aspergillus hancockii]|nr:hypothetical protein BBP40_008708 [Aspergillus hancockii]
MTRTKIRKVAIIGAGISGVVSAGHLLNAGFHVTVFERNKAAGGVWLYDERRPVEPQYPAVKPSETDQPAKDRREREKFVLEHAPPGPCYEGLRNNVPTPLIRVKLNAWPEGTPDFVSHNVIKDYIQDTSRKARVHDVTIYGARVKDLRKHGDKWEVLWSTVLEHDQSDAVKEVEEISTFDAVIVASGHYHAPRVPDIPGLSAAKTKWASRILHSKGYRKPDRFKNKNVLLIGGGVSSTDIAKEIGPVANTVYQSTRNGEFDLSPDMLPENGVRIGEISHFELPNDESVISNDEHLPLTIHLKSGQKLCGIDSVIICTGYHIALPFLPKYHNDEIAPENADENILVTDGTQVHNLHKDVFYIPDPTLAFIGVPYYTATFTLFEFQAIVATQVFSGFVNVPSEAAMRSEYLAKIKSVGSGKKFHSLKDKEEFYVQDLLEWVNADRAALSLGPIEGHTAKWLEAKEAHRQRIAVLFQQSGRRDSGIGQLPVLAVCS